MVYYSLVSGSGGGEQISLEVSSEGVDRWHCSDKQCGGKLLQVMRSGWAEGTAAGEHCVVCRLEHWQQLV